jgi:PPOX class probable F420-dependent enzyme
MSSTQLPYTKQNAFTALRISNVALLTTFRRNGQGVITPVGIRLAEEKAYFTTWSTTGKVKRLVNNPHVTLAPYSKMRRKVIGPTIQGIARRLEGAEAADISSRVLKPTFWSRLWTLIYTMRGWQSLLYEVVPVTGGQNIERAEETGKAY